MPTKQSESKKPAKIVTPEQVERLVLHKLPESQQKAIAAMTPQQRQKTLEGMAFYRTALLNLAPDKVHLRKTPPKPKEVRPEQVEAPKPVQPPPEKI